jgi:bifunctional DNA-binding transcriptional regulator/antitoxin component of YhaV-PrlF toxin-antitoxin module
MSTTTNEFRLSIGAKRQLTLPCELLEQLQVPERGELLVQVIGDHAVITPMISVPRAQMPEELRRTFESRRGAHSSDIPLARFLKQMGYDKTAQKVTAPRLSVAERVQRLANLTANEKAAFEQARAGSSRRTPRSSVDRAEPAQSRPSGMGRKLRESAREKAGSGS